MRKTIFILVAAALIGCNQRTETTTSTDSTGTVTQKTTTVEVNPTVDTAATAAIKEGVNNAAAATKEAAHDAAAATKDAAHDAAAATKNAADKTVDAAKNTKVDAKVEVHKTTTTTTRH